MTELPVGRSINRKLSDRWGLDGIVQHQWQGAASVPCPSGAHRIDGVGKPWPPRFTRSWRAILRSLADSSVVSPSLLSPSRSPVEHSLPRADDRAGFSSRQKSRVDVPIHDARIDVLAERDVAPKVRDAERLLSEDAKGHEPLGVVTCTHEFSSTMCGACRRWRRRGASSNSRSLLFRVG